MHDPESWECLAYIVNNDLIGTILRPLSFSFENMVISQLLKILMYDIAYGLKEMVAETVWND